MNILNKLYSWYGKKTVFLFLAAIVALLVIGVIFAFSSNGDQSEAAPQSDSLSRVKLGSISQLQSQSLFRVIGEVKAVSEARLQAESSGRITSVNANLGDTVQAGFVLATLENSAQRAALLQAEGSYEAALAGAASSKSGTESAETSLSAALTSGVSTYRSAFISADSSVRNTIDDLFTDPAGATPGFRLDSYGSAVALNQERKDLEPILDEWSAKTATADIGNIRSRLGEAITNTQRILQYTETLSAIVSRQDPSSIFTQTQKDSLEAEFLGIRSNLNQTLQALESAQTAIKSSEEALDRAKIAGSSNEVSLADAQVKSALGSLQAARSSYEKTLVRTPISGVVNALYLKEGEYASQGQPSAIIANNNALEITTALSSADAELVSIGDKVFVNGATEGLITAVAPAIDPASGKKEIKIGVVEDSQLTNGETVTIEFKRSEAKSSDTIHIPLSAVKIGVDSQQVFTVSGSGELEAHAVSMGSIMGDLVEITQGLSADMVIVLDARGLRAGQKVEIITE